MHAVSGQDSPFARATMLARKGHYASARACLREAQEADACTQAEALDLEARILAQQGLYLEAERCWEQALAHDASNPEFRRALARLRSRARSTAAAAATLAGAVFGLVVLALLIWQVAVSTPQLERRLLAAEAANEALKVALTESAAAAERRAEEMAQRLDSATGQLIADVGRGNAMLRDQAAEDVAREDRQSTAMRQLETAVAETSAVTGNHFDSLQAQLTGQAEQTGATVRQLSDSLESLGAAVTGLLPNPESTEAFRTSVLQQLADVRRTIGALAGSQESVLARLVEAPAALTAAIAAQAAQAEPAATVHDLAAIASKLDQLQSAVGALALHLSMSGTTGSGDAADPGAP